VVTVKASMQKLLEGCNAMLTVLLPCYDSHQDGEAVNRTADSPLRHLYLLQDHNMSSHAAFSKDFLQSASLFNHQKRCLGSPRNVTSQGAVSVLQILPNADIEENYLQVLSSSLIYQGAVFKGTANWSKTSFHSQN
jgi:hypothetical protein